MKIERFHLETSLYDKSAFNVVAYGRAVITSTGELGIKRMARTFTFRTNESGEIISAEKAGA